MVYLTDGIPQILVAPERGDVCGTQTEGFRRLYQTLLTKFVQTWLTPLSLRDISPFRGDECLRGKFTLQTPR